MPKVALYARVSTDEQVRSGYSIAEQMHRLEAHARQSELSVVERICDEGFSGASSDRPGLERVMELAEAGEIEAVIAVKRDRFFRSRLYRLLMDRDLEELGVRLEALNDTGHMIGDGVSDSFAEWEREEITKRTLAGKIQKARSGKVVAGHAPNFGFRFTKDRNGYEVDEAKMISVRRLFELVARGESLSATARTLNEESLPAPGKKWIRHTVRQMVLDDVYKPHSLSEAAVLVSRGQMLQAVADTLSGPFGVWWYNRSGTVKSRRRNKVREKPEAEWVAVPVPDSGIPRRTVDTARKIVEGNELNAKSTAGGREWELSGGIMRCAGCGNAMMSVGSVAYRELKSGTKKYHLYNYRCDTERRGGECPYGKTISAKKAESAVWEAVKAVMLEPERLEAAMKDVARATKKADPRRRKSILKLLDDLGNKRDGLIDLAADRIITKAELSEKLKPIDAQISALQAEAASLQSEPQSEDVRMVLRRLKTQAPKFLENLNPEQKRRLYLDLDLRAYFEPGKLSLTWATGLPMGDIQLDSAGRSKRGLQNTLKIYAEVSLASPDSAVSFRVA